jgi:hypothetical protein
MGANLCIAQQAFYDVTAANGNGVRFWQSDSYKIHMGNSTEYLYGPVNDFSIKTNMSNGTPGRGWTWGVTGQVPVAAINSLGNMQIAGTFQSNGLFLGVGTLTPTAKLEINQAGGSSGQNQGLKIWAGNTNTYFGNSQIQFSYGGGGGGYSHAIKSRHNSGAIPGNAIDFYLWQPGDPVNGEGSLSTMTLNGGLVGIGTTTPGTKLTLRTSTATQGFVITNCDATGNQSHFGFTTADQSRIGLATESYFNTYNDGKWNLNSGNTSGTTLPISLNTDGTSRLYIKTNGNIGIGTLSPDQMLTVKGIIHAQEVRVDLSVPGPDYVFEKDYKLPTLEEIKSCIDQNKHLPEVPSAAEMEKNGIQLGEMNMLLLKKVEELTLYLIEQNKFIAQLKEERRVSSDPLGKRIEELMLYILKQEERALEQGKRIKALEEKK